ncbi:MAG: (d)CMP kinase [Pseudomonadota bacterium]
MTARSSESVPVITVDGPGGAGKGTLSFHLAQVLDWHMLDSGALYRVTALAALSNDAATDDENEVAEVAANLKVRFEPASQGLTKVFLDEEDVSLDIRSEACGVLASKVASMQSVRQALLQRQRSLARAPGLVADGRDMGTVVFPNADLKIYLTASAECRAARRREQLLAQGQSVSLARLLEGIEERDARDRNRSSSPLKPAEDALEIDCSALTAAQVFDKALSEARLRGLA